MSPSSEFSPDLAKGLLNGTLDAAFMRPELGTDDLVFRVFVEEPLVVVLPSGHRLASHKAIDPARSPASRSSPSPAPRRPCDSSSTTTSTAVASTRGFALLPVYAEKLLPCSVVAPRIKGADVPAIPLMAAHHKANTSPALKLFLSRIDELIARVSKKRGQAPTWACPFLQESCLPAVRPGPRPSGNLRVRLATEPSGSFVPVMTDVHVLVTPRVMLLDLAAVSDTLRIATELGGAFKVMHVGPSARAMTSAGLALTGIAPLPDTLRSGSIVIVPGCVQASVDYETKEGRLAAEWLGAHVTAAHRLCTICSGVFLAAKAGLLRGRACTTHHSLTARLARDYPATSVLENRVFVRDGNLWTSAGVTTGTDLVLHLVSEDAGPELALAVAREMVVYFRRSGADPQLSPWLAHRNHMHSAVHRTQDAVIRDPAFPWTLRELSEVACTSPRHLARLFRSHAGVSPLSYLRQVRTAAAKEIVGTSQHSMEVIAEMVGFSSAEQMRRAWRRFEHANPTDQRRAGGDAVHRPAEEAA